MNHCSLYTVCTPCKVNQTCVSRNERGECTSKEPVVKECCKEGFDPRCKALKEKATEETGKKIEKAAAELEAIENKLEQLSNELADLDRELLHPSKTG